MLENNIKVPTIFRRKFTLAVSKAQKLEHQDPFKKPVAHEMRGSLALQITANHINNTSSLPRERRENRHKSPIMDALDLILGDSLLPAIVELGCAYISVASHVLRILERAAILEVCRNPGASH